jgi:hypothetical protein
MERGAGRESRREKRGGGVPASVPATALAAGEPRPLRSNSLATAPALSDLCAVSIHFGRPRIKTPARLAGAASASCNVPHAPFSSPARAPASVIFCSSLATSVPTARAIGPSD